MNTKTSPLVTVLCAVLLLAIGCKRQEQAGTPPSVPAKVGAERPALMGATAVSLLPRTTLFVAAVDGIGPALDRLGRESFMATHRDLYEKGVALVTQEVGHNLLDPKNLVEVGIDPTKPAGIAWLDVAGETGALFVPLSSEEKLKTTLYALAPKVGVALEAQAFGDAVLIRAKRDRHLALVLRGDQAVLIYADRSGGFAEDAARNIATLPPESSLGTDPSYLAALGKLDFGSQVAGYLNVSAIAAQVQARANRRMDGPEDASYEEQNLDAAVKRQAPPDELARLREQVASAKRWRERDKRRRTARVEAIEKLLMPMKRIAVGARIEGGAATAKAVVSLGADSLLGRTLVRGEGPLPIVQTLAERPMLLVGGRVDPAAMLDLVELLAATDGEDLAEDEGELAAKVGIDLRKDVLPLLTGDAGLAVTGDAEALVRTEGKRDTLGASVIVGVKDEAKARELLDRLRANEAVAKATSWDPERRALMVPVPGWRTLTVTVSGGAVVISSDPGLPKRLASPGAGPSGLMKEERLSALLGKNGTSAVLAYDMLVFRGLLLEGKQEVSRPVVAVEAPGGADVPPSPAYAQKEKEIEGARKELEAAFDEADRTSNEALIDVMKRFGTLALTARAEPSEIVIEGGLFTSAPTFGDLAAGTALSVTKADEARHGAWRRESELREQERKLEDELRAIRMKDIEAARVVPLPPVPAIEGSAP